jgi:hypothetical protein
LPSGLPRWYHQRNRSRDQPPQALPQDCILHREGELSRLYWNDRGDQADVQPVGTGTIDAAKTVTDKLIANGNIVSVGYMLRYLRCVQKMKQIIHENNLTVMATNARYVSDNVLSTPIATPAICLLVCARGVVALFTVYCAHYSPPHTRRLLNRHGGTSPSTWDQSLSRVHTSVICRDTSEVMSTSTLLCESTLSFEQCCSRLSRLGPSCVTGMIADFSAKSVEFYEVPGKLSKVPVDESKIPEEQRIPRITSAVW